MDAARLELAREATEAQLEKIAMCKRGIVCKWYSERLVLHRLSAKDVPHLTKAQLNKVLKKNLPKLVSLLELRVSPSMGLQLADLYTNASITKYNNLYNKVTLHPKMKETSDFNKKLTVQNNKDIQQRDARLTQLNAEVDRIKMALLVGTIKFGAQSIKALEQFEQAEW